MMIFNAKGPNGIATAYNRIQNALKSDLHIPLPKRQILQQKAVAIESFARSFGIPLESKLEKSPHYEVCCNPCQDGECSGRMSRSDLACSAINIAQLVALFSTAAAGIFFFFLREINLQGVVDLLLSLLQGVQNMVPM